MTQPHREDDRLDAAATVVLRMLHEPSVEEQMSKRFAGADGVVLETRLDVDDVRDDLVDGRDAGRRSRFQRDELLLEPTLLGRRLLQ